MKFKDIPQFPHSNYQVDVDFRYLEETLDSWNLEETPLILNPEWQRGHVWTEDQQRAYVEYVLKGGNTGRDIYFNCSSWQCGYNTPIYCVDGLQRLTAIRKFIMNELTVFGGNFYKDFEDSINCIWNARFTFRMIQIKNKKELLKIYLDFNSGGTPHNPKELERVAKMIEDTPENEKI